MLLLLYVLSRDVDLDDCLVAFMRTQTVQYTVQTTLHIQSMPGCWGPSQLMFYQDIYYVRVDNC